mmetsp:Transcript_22046/g.54518  ORF Transcript_22046/g.54518 Transcript_22046/m.54518 type:complete len:301 (+) Transcript_22046:362-1264(+)
MNKSVDRLDIQMVRRLIKKQEVGLLPRNNGKRHATLLSTGQGANRSKHHVIAQPKFAQMPAQLGDCGRREEHLHVFQRSSPQHELIDMVLREIPDSNFARLLHLAFESNVLRGNQLNDCRLACPIGSNESNTSVCVNRKVQILEDDSRWSRSVLVLALPMLLSVSKSDVAQLNSSMCARKRAGVREGEGKFFFFSWKNHFRLFHFLDHLETTLSHLCSFRVVTEAVDKLLQMRNSGIVAFCTPRHVLQFLGPCLLKIVEVSSVRMKQFVFDVNDIGAHIVQEIAVVRNHDKCMRPLGQII